MPDDKPKKKVDLGAIAFAKVTKLEKRVKEIEQYIVFPSDIQLSRVKSLPSP